MDQNILSLFEKYRLENNRTTLLNLLSVSLVIEVVYAILAGYFFDGSVVFGNIVDPKHLANMPYVIIIYISLIFLVYSFFRKYERLIGTVGAFFILHQRIWIFFQNPQSRAILIIWGIFALILAWFFWRPWLMVFLIGSSIAFILISFFSFNQNELDLLYFTPYFWLTGLVSIVSLHITFKNHSKQQKDFLFKHKLIVENEENNRILNYDKETGLHSRYYMDKYFRLDLSDEQREKSFLLVMNLDNYKYCHDLLGKKTAGLYLTVFIRIVRFLIINDDDKIARTDGEGFAALLLHYRSSWEIEEKVNRYNQMLKEEFDTIISDERIVPNFSYRIIPLSGHHRLEEILQDEYVISGTPSPVNLIKSHINYTSLLNAGNVVAIVWLPKQDWPIGYVSDNVKSLLGYTSDEILHEHILFGPLIHPEDKKRIDDEYALYIKTKREHFEQKYRLRRKNGTYIWIRDYSVPVWRGEKIIQINGYIYDIDLEMDATKRIEENAERLKNIVDATNVGTWEWNLQGSEVICNDRLLQLFGLDKNSNEVFNTILWESMIHPEDQEKNKKNLNEYLIGKRDSYDVKYRLKRTGGNWIWIHDKGRIMKWDDTGSPLTMFGSTSDVTESQESTAMLEHAEKLGALGRLAGGIAHDMNNQLMKIRGSAELASIVDTVDNYRTSVESIKQLSDSAAWIVHQLLLFSGNELFEPDFCDINGVLSDLVEMLDHTFEKEIRITMKVPEKPLTVNADRSLLNKAFFNICFNAKEAMTQGGVLSIEAEQILSEKDFVTFTGDLPAGSYARIAFTDEGEGIEEEEVDKIFEPFFTTKAYGTQGLGLAKVVSAIKKHNGGIQVKSSKGQGTEFSLYFPIQEELETTPLANQLPPEWIIDHSLEILVIDDEQVIGNLLTEYFQYLNWRVSFFSNPMKGIEYFRKEKDKIGLVILDMLMPDMSGAEVFKRMKSVKNTVRVLFISGYSQGVEINEKNQANIAGFMTKPVKLDDLKKLVEQELGHTKS